MTITIRSLRRSHAARRQGTARDRQRCRGAAATRLRPVSTRASYTYGHRNVQGITFRPGTGQPFIAEHGPNHSDEVTALVAGATAAGTRRIARV